MKTNSKIQKISLLVLSFKALHAPTKLSSKTHKFNLRYNLSGRKLIKNISHNTSTPLAQKLP